MRASRLFLAGLAASTFLAAPAQAARVLAPHRAVYDLTLKDASDRSGITGLSGRMVYEFNGSACEGYTVTFRFVSRIQTQDASRVSDQQTTTFEEGVTADTLPTVAIAARHTGLVGIEVGLGQQLQAEQLHLHPQSRKLVVGLVDCLKF